MVEEVTDGDGAAVFGEVREDVGQAVLVAELAVADEQHDGRGRELFRDRGQAEGRPAVDRAHALQVPDAARAEVDDLPVFEDDDPRAGLALGADAREEGVGEPVRLVRGPGRPARGDERQGQQRGSRPASRPVPWECPSASAS